MTSIIQSLPAVKSRQITSYMIRRGCYVFPLCKGRTRKYKQPLIKAWARDATQDPAQIDHWIENFGRSISGWGIALKLSDLTVVDVDVKDGVPGDETFDVLDLEHGFPETFTVRTASGGRHHYFRGWAGQSIGGLGTGVDLPGYAVAPGSLIPGKGVYSILDNRRIAPTPPWIATVLMSKPHRERDPNANKPASDVEIDSDQNIALASEYLRHAAPPSLEAENTGDNTTYKVAARVKDFGISGEQCFLLMLDLYNVEDKCVPLWEPEDLRRKVENAYNHGSEQIGIAVSSDVPSDSVEEVVAEFGDDVAKIADSVKPMGLGPKTTTLMGREIKVLRTPKKGRSR